MEMETRDVQTVQQKIMGAINSLIDRELPHLAEVARPLLRIEACVCSNPDEPSLHQKSLLATIDIKKWNYQPPSPHHDRSGHGPAQEMMQTPISLSSDAEQHHRRSSRSRRSQTNRSDSDTNSDATQESESTKRRKVVGGLRLARAPIGIVEQPTPPTTPRSPSPKPRRQLQTNARAFPQRKRPQTVETRALRPSSWDKLVLGIWEQIHGPIRLDWRGQYSFPTAQNTFRDVSALCRSVTQVSRCSRSLEVIVQAHWMECYDAHVESLAANHGHVSLSEAKKAAMSEACRDFGWSEKDLRNKMAVWRGYHELKTAGGWVTLVFAGAGLYRYCKYRIGFGQDSMSQLQRLRPRFEVAADTLHPEWRTLLSVIGLPSDRVYEGHPHDWVVDEDSDPVPLAATYLQREPQFTFQNITQSVIDQDVWGDVDPRRTSDSSPYRCSICGNEQSNNAALNRCRCFPDLYGDKTSPRPVQIFRTKNGRDNGLISCRPFERGTAIGEFVGLITSGLTGIDVMEGQAEGGLPYQIWQGRQGNYTRFINHSCQPNCQFQKFTWLGIERTVVVSKGVAAGREITVDYGDRYWRHLDKRCRCLETSCRYNGS